MNYVKKYWVYVAIAIAVAAIVYLNWPDSTPGGTAKKSGTSGTDTTSGTSGGGAQNGGGKIPNLIDQFTNFNLYQ